MPDIGAMRRGMESGPESDYEPYLMRMLKKLLMETEFRDPRALKTYYDPGRYDEEEPVTTAPDTTLADTRAAAQASIRGREDKESVAKAEKIRDAAGAQAREQDEWVRSVGYEPLPISDPEKGILVGGESPQVGEPTSFKERLIRAQASAAGRAGRFGAEPDSLDFQKSLRNAGGGFSDPEMTPELAARLRDRDEWLAGQPFRDARFRLSTRDVDPVAAAPALAQVAAEERMAQEQRSRDVLIDALSGMESGKIPWDKAAAYEARGLNIPQDRIGISGEEALNEANVLMAQAQEDMGKASSLDSMMNPNLGLSGEFGRLVAPIIAQYAQEANAGDPQAAKDRFWERFAEIRAAFLAEVRQRPQGLQENFGTQIERGVERE